MFQSSDRYWIRTASLSSLWGGPHGPDQGKDHAVGSRIRVARCLLQSVVRTGCCVRNLALQSSSNIPTWSARSCTHNDLSQNNDWAIVELLMSCTPSDGSYGFARVAKEIL